mmetsp:Transcript_27985/g.65310  ORF Transcript_27985/g.65310 Transcript_27985/m.65310 type:complete len:219 (+) Transcript_27985:46-702(+)
MSSCMAGAQKRGDRRTSPLRIGRITSCSTLAPRVEICTQLLLLALAVMDSVDLIEVLLPQVNLAALLARLRLGNDVLDLLGFGPLGNLDRCLPALTFRLPAAVQDQPEPRPNLLKFHSRKLRTGLGKDHSVARNGDFRWSLLLRCPCFANVHVEGGAHYHLLHATQEHSLRFGTAEEVQQQTLTPLRPLVCLKAAALEENQGLRPYHGFPVASAETGH